MVAHCQTVQSPSSKYLVLSTVLEDKEISKDITAITRNGGKVVPQIGRMLKSLGKHVYVKPQPDPLSLTPEQQQILDTEPGDIAYVKFMEMGFSNFIIAEEFYDEQKPSTPRH